MCYSINISELKEIEKNLLASKAKNPKKFGQILLIYFIIILIIFTYYLYS